MKMAAHKHIEQKNTLLCLWKKETVKYLAVIFALVFLVFQSSSLVHSHEEDLNKHPDCTFCLNIGAGEDLLPSAAIVSVAFKTAFLLQYLDPDLVTIAVNRPRARSPPVSTII
jgi:hypothetical protein